MSGVSLACLHFEQRMHGQFKEANAVIHVHFDINIKLVRNARSFSARAHRAELDAGE